MNRLEKLQSALDGLKAERVQITQSWYLQNCWVTQSKPGGTARTKHKYWQVRSRQPMLDGKTVKHLKVDEVEDYKAAIARGRRIKQIDQQIEKLQQQLAKLIFTTGSLNRSSDTDEHPFPTSKLPASERSQRVEETVPTLGELVDLAEQERLVQEVLTNSRALRVAVRQSINRGRKLGARNIELRN
ncbi:hypothetical protein H6F89_25360 [Cyanobacteria bacterium FACHB-63]|nr:hypothetical protein [Cyanobacteria bacterium FACHB-63]